MSQPSNKPAVLLLADGTSFQGKAVGAIGTATGEIAFNTAMTGYQEVFTDPSYFGQILVMSAAHIGNYGVHEDEIESGKIHIAGVVTKNFSSVYSRAGASGSLHAYFERDGIPGISGVDTRALIRHIRSKGAMNAILSTETTDLDVLKNMLGKVPSMEGLELSSKVTCTEAYEVGDPADQYRVAVLDFGAKRGVIRCLTERGCFVKVFPMHTPMETMEAWDPHGYLLSNGPGDPSVMTSSIDLVGRLADLDKPVMGICLGHQLIALSQGVNTIKMFNGHRGVNHPVLNLGTGRGEITSQNHGFTVERESTEENQDIEITHENVNDGSIAGIRLKNKPVFSVQYHPEASPGPHDSRYLFDRFVETLKTGQSAIAKPNLQRS